MAGAQNVDTVAGQIGAANTLVRQPDGLLSAYNTDWSAAISAIEQGLEQASGGSTGVSTPTADRQSPTAAGSQQQSPLNGKTVLVLGAGGAGRALAFGALQRNAQVHYGMLMMLCDCKLLTCASTSRAEACEEGFQGAATW